ncbi:MAG: sulfite exporter TauE/SafE family protein [Ignavibacteriae bacterium]|nr:sulfite exporter TauE/SafE family protein [Ignavibacteria bacterium]MBI3365613.1 sulfite exporter TauE/SafE family protein [Ignavibacteriota bacterium]
MPDYIIYIITFLASLVTLLAGFGLGTILTPVFALAFDVKLAILLVAIVHFFNNAFKFVLFRKHVDFSIVKRFGVLSIAGAMIGALLQSYLYSQPLKIFLGIVLVALGVGELLPKSMSFTFPRKVDVIGGLLSGVLGGLVGNQGAIRSAYLLNYNVSKEAFIATATIIALFIDATRIPIYLTTQREFFASISWNIALVVLIALAGTLVGKRLLQHFSSLVFKKIVAGFVVVMGLAFSLRLL